MAFVIAAIECSLMPKRMFLPRGNSPPSSISVLFDAARSALPPKTPGSCAAIACKILEFESLVAKISLNSGILILEKSGFCKASKSSLFSGSKDLSPSLNSFSRSSPFFSAVLNLARQSAGMWNSSRLQPAASLLFLSSSAPSGAPCTFGLPARLTDPLPIVVFAMISIGFLASRLALKALSI